jgi:hypothetical protein
VVSLLRTISTARLNTNMDTNTRGRIPIVR